MREADATRFVNPGVAMSLLLILSIVVGCTAATTPPDPPTEAAPQPQGDVLLEVEGDGEAISDPFEVKGNWEIRWDSRGQGDFSVELFTEDGASRGMIVQGKGGDEGSAFASEEGRFSLLISAEGPWSIRVLGNSP